MTSLYRKQKHSSCESQTQTKEDAVTTQKIIASVTQMHHRADATNLHKIILQH